MTARASVGAVLASALRKVVGGRLQASNLGEVWREDRTWLELARELEAALGSAYVLVDKTAGAELVMVEKAVYEQMKADAAQMRRVRGYVEEYEARRPEVQKQASKRRQSPYAQWATENMPSSEKK